MAAEVADVAEFNNPVVAWLPLDIQSVVVGVGQLVSAIIDTQRDGLAAIFDASDIGQVLTQVGRLGVGGWRTLDVRVRVRQVSGCCSRRDRRRSKRIAAFLQAAAGWNVIAVKGRDRTALRGHKRKLLVDAKRATGDGANSV